MLSYYDCNNLFIRAVFGMELVKVRDIYPGANADELIAVLVSISKEPMSSYHLVQ